MTSCCACCCFYPKYKRKVDNIYPRSLDAPLVKPEVDKLQYYVTIHPEKLSKIAEYLYQNLKWGLNGTYKNRNYVKNTIEAADKILLAITPQNLNYYATNYLKIIQKLLEQGGGGGGGSGNNGGGMASNGGGVGVSSSASGNLNSNSANNLDYLEYQKLAAGMFQKFCEKEAANSSTTSYNLNYDTFVCQFSAMCYNNNKEIRSSGLQCLATMVKRLVPEDSLRAGYLWDNMDKIVPALLFIMHENFKNTHHKYGAENTDYYDTNEKEEHDMERYIFGGLGLKNNDEFADSKLPTPPADELDNIKIKFRKNAAKSSDNLIGGGSQTNIEKVSASSSTQSSPKEGTVMISFNNQRRNTQDQSPQQQQQTCDPDHEAKMLLKNLACKADYTTISKIVLPILAYLDDNKPNGWEYSRFVRCVFLILMYNVKQQHAIVIKNLINHLDSHRNSSAQLKCFIIRAISICIRIAAMHSVGTTGQIIEIFTNLLKHLNFSVEKASECKKQLLDSSLRPDNELSQQQSLQREIIAAMGQFTSHLPDYAKNDVIMFIARQINSQQFTYSDVINKEMSGSNATTKDQQRAKYFECLHEICQKYKPTQLFSAFTSGQFLEDILKLTLVSDWNSRRKAHDILHLLLDKYQFLNKIKSFKPNLFAFASSVSTGDSASISSTSAIVRIKENANKLNKSTSSNTSLYNKSTTNAASSSSLNKQQKPSNMTTNEITRPNALTSQKNLRITRNQTYLSQLELNESNLSTSKEDMHFMRKYGGVFLAHLNENLFLANNRRENYESIYLTVGFFLIGLFNEKEFLIDFIRFGFHIQELALLNHEQTTFTFGSQCSVHKFVAAYFLLLSKTSGLLDFQRYCSEICDLRRKRDLFKFVYPEYILLDSALLSDSGNHSASQSLTEIEGEFKRDLTSSAKEYANSIQTQGKSDEKDKSKSKLNSNETNKKLNANLDENQHHQMAPWLFDKKTIGTILENNGFSTTLLFMPNSDFSLSVAYLQSTLASLQTVLRFRSPYSNSFDSIVAFNPISNDANHGGVAEYPSGKQGHHRDFSNTQFNSKNNVTPRRSIDADSNTDDGTSYDSVSQVSVDPNGLEQLDSNMVKFYTDDNQNTVTSFNFLRHQYNLQQQQFNETSSFEMIKRVLFNDNNSLINGSNFSNSGVGGVGGSSTIGPNSTGLSTIINTSKAYKVGGGSGGGGVNSSSALNLDQNSSKSLSDQQRLQLESNNNTEIISEFRHKNYDELKKNYIRSTQTYLNQEKYQKVFDFISKEHTNANTTTSSSMNGTNPNVNSQLNGSSGNLNNSNLSLSNGSNQSTSMTSGISLKETYQQKSFPNNNDIEFPQLFMY